MRHTFGFLLGVLLTPGLLYGAAWGYSQAAGSFDPIGGEISDRTRLYGAFALLAAVGLVMGVVVVSRWASPFVSLIPALTLIAWSVYFFAAPGQALKLVADVPPAGELDVGLRMLLGSGVFALMGCALLVPMGTPRRWAGRDAEDQRAEERTAEYF